MAFKTPPPWQEFPALEEKILRFWRRQRIFAKTLARTKKDPAYVVFEGPPTANGRPHIGHAVTRIFKDVIPRYKTMQGYYVLRKGGWDTQGLPVEIEVEKELGLSGKQDIENLVPGDINRSIVKFNELCKRSVWKYVKLWEKMIERVGNWFDLDYPYITYDKDYIESIWWAFKEYWQKGLLYRGYKVVPYCTRCGTPLSSHEVAQGYEEVVENSVYVKFPLVGERDTYFLAWTTTPWTLPGNIALAVDPKAEYVRVLSGRGETFILAKARAGALGFDGKAKVIEGTELVGRRYHPLFPWLRSLIPRDVPQFTVVPADFVSLTEGTGIVHTAVMYGEEDFILGVKLGLPQRHLVGRDGRFLAEAGWLATKYVKDADPLIVHDLKTRGLTFKEEKVSHQYPFCWRCHRPLIYYGLEGWFIKTTAFAEELKKNNRGVNWVPPYVGRGRMGDWYETLIDWSISRNRYWGTPLPVWVCDKNPDHIEVVGSYEELEKKIKKRLPKDFDPHRPYIDEYTWLCSKNDGGCMQRTPEVTDAWHDSGCMPFAQWHYPFENREIIEKRKQFPADYISEGIDQTRGWFFSLQVVSTLLFGVSPYKNVVVFAHALDQAGRKMSKHLGNVLDPLETIAQVGADPLRWFFLTSVNIGTPYRVSVEVLKETIRRFFLILWNCLSFFVTYANLNQWSPTKTGQAAPFGDLLDRWIIAKSHELVEKVTTNMEAFDFPAAGRAIQDFVVGDLSTWYIRCSRNRVGPGADPADAAACHRTLYQALKTLSLLLAPLTPFLAEIIHQILRERVEPSSVHLLSWPKKGRVDRKLIELMSKARKVVEVGLRQRKEKGIRLRQPLALATLTGVGKWPPALEEIVAKELNVKKIEIVAQPRRFSVSLDVKLTKELKEEGLVREVIRLIQDLRKKAGYRFDEQIILEIKAPLSLKKVFERFGWEIEKATWTKRGKLKKVDQEGELSGARVKVGR